MSQPRFFAENVSFWYLSKKEAKVYYSYEHLTMLRLVHLFEEHSIAIADVEVYSEDIELEDVYEERFDFIVFKTKPYTDYNDEMLFNKKKRIGK